MKDTMIYPTVDRIIELNKLAIEVIKVKKADKAQVMSEKKITDTVKEVKESNGDIYDKALLLLKNLVQKHPFASGNRRTAFIATKDFLTSNDMSFKIADNPSYAPAMRGIREGYYSDKEIKEWLKNGKIREFKR